MFLGAVTLERRHLAAIVGTRIFRFFAYFIARLEPVSLKRPRIWRRALSSHDHGGLCGYKGKRRYKSFARDRLSARTRRRRLRAGSARTRRRRLKRIVGDVTTLTSSRARSV